MAQATLVAIKGARGPSSSPIYVGYAMPNCAVEARYWCLESFYVHLLIVEKPSRLFTIF
jgi:hypothetical protein